MSFITGTLEPIDYLIVKRCAETSYLHPDEPPLTLEDHPATIRLEGRRRMAEDLDSRPPIESMVPGAWEATLRETYTLKELHDHHAAEHPALTRDTVDDDRAQMRESGFPSVKESDHQDLAKQLDGVTAGDHPFRPQLNSILRKGPALPRADRDLLEVEAAKRGIQFPAPTPAKELDDEHEDSTMVESAGSPLRESDIPLSDFGEQQVKPMPERELSQAEVMADLHIPAKD